MKVNLTERTAKTGGEVYTWSDLSTNRIWDRIRKAYIHKDLKKYAPVNDLKLIARLDSAVDRAVEKREERAQAEFQRNEAKHSKQQGDGVRIYSQDGKSFFNISVTRDSKDSDLAHVSLLVGGKWKYHYAVEGIEMERFEETVREWRPRD